MEEACEVDQLKMMENHVDGLSSSLYLHGEDWVMHSLRKTGQQLAGFSLLDVFVLLVVCKLQSRTRMKHA